MKILITGGNGFLGNYLVNYFSKHFDVIAAYHKQIPNPNKKHIHIDIIDKDSLKKVEQLKPNMIIHCAAMKDVLICEKNKEQCYNVNVNGTKSIIDVCKKINAKLIYISTDYVFKGDQGNYKEGDIKEPTTVHGKSKSEAEDLIIDSNINYTICRTAGIYSFLGNNFLTFILNKLRNNEEINAFTNIYNTPTYIKDFAETISVIIKKDKKGIFNIAGKERINRYNFAKKIAKIFNLDESLIKEDIDSSIRPKDLSLNTENTQKELETKFLTIEQGLNEIKKDIR